MTSPQPGGFCSADALPPSSTSYVEELEARIRVQDDLIAAQEAEIAQLGIAPWQQPRGPSEDLKTSERLILLARINDLTIERNALETALGEKIKRLETIVETYLIVNPEIFNDDENALLLRAALARKAQAATEHSSQIADLEFRVGDLERRVETKATPKKTEVNAKHLDRLADALLMKSRQGQKGVTYAEAARILRLDKTRVIQLRSLISSDHRFNIEWHPNRKNMKIICLRR